MQEIYIDNLAELLKNKRMFEEQLDVQITNKGKNVFVEGDPEKEYTALHVLEAVNLGFSLDRALILKDENMILQTLNMHGITKRKDLRPVKGRIIGTYGSTLATLNSLTSCAISVKDNKVGLIGDTESIDEAMIALTSMIQGSKRSNVYARLEREMKKKRENPLDKSNIKDELKHKKK